MTTNPCKKSPRPKSKLKADVDTRPPIWVFRRLGFYEASVWNVEKGRFEWAKAMRWRDAAKELAQILGLKPEECRCIEQTA